MASALLGGCAGAPAGHAEFGGTALFRGEPLANVFVHVKAGAPPGPYPPPAGPATLDQLGLEFVPRVLGVRVGQALRITSQDSSPHNVFCQPFENAGFNVNMNTDETIERRFAKPELMIELQCHLHAHMRAYVAVLDHPFFAVSGRDGRFRLDGLPPGRYRLSAWSEHFGAKEWDVDLPSPALRLEFP